MKSHGGSSTCLDVKANMNATSGSHPGPNGANADVDAA